MAEQNNGGPAFPVTEQHGANYGECGMTLRDYFAAHALTGLMADPGADPTNKGKPEYVAAYAYALADAMLAAREGK